MLGEARGLCTEFGFWLLFAAALVWSAPRVRSGSAGGGQLGSHELGRPDDAVCWGGDQSAVGGDIGDPAVVAGTTPPRCAGGPGELVVERVAGHDLPGAAGLQRYTVEGVFPVGGDAGDAGVLIEAKVVGHGAARDELRGAGGVERVRV